MLFLATTTIVELVGLDTFNYLEYCAELPSLGNWQGMGAI